MSDLDTSSQKFADEVIESSNQNELNDSKVRIIAKRILELESAIVNKQSVNDDEVKKQIMKIIEEELKCN